MWIQKRFQNILFYKVQILIVINIITILICFLMVSQVMINKISIIFYFWIKFGWISFKWNFISKLNMTIFRIAIEKGNSDIVKLLLSNKNININEKFNDVFIKYSK